MNVTINNCNNIRHASISIVDKKLNIKLAPNGTGKSTIARAISMNVEKLNELQTELMPFNLRKENPENNIPKVDCDGEINSVMCFNEDYIESFVYKPDELLNNSFEIFIKNDDYKNIEGQINNMISDIKGFFVKNVQLEAFISDLKEMGNAFRLTKNGLSKSSVGVKALSSGNKIKNVPVGLEMYTPFIQSENSVNWIDWQTKGCEFMELSEACPFCTSVKTDKIDIIKRISEEYDKSTIKNLVSLINIIQKLGDYFSQEAKEKMQTITAQKDGLAPEHEDFLASVKRQIDLFTEKLENLKTFSSFHFKEGESISEKLHSYKLDLTFFSELDSQKMRDEILPINTSIDEIIKKDTELLGKINIQRREIKKAVDKYQKEINEFLTYAGYKYKVEIVGSGNNACLKLKHEDYEQHLSGGTQHLSFGERNAFAIVLFMYECLSKKPDLIILDDPISSFDKNKKFAMLEMLFLRKPELCFKNKTVLMLTHDIEPIIDTMKSIPSKFANHIESSYLRLENGKINEHSISKPDIMTFAQIYENIICSGKDMIIKLIFLRRYIEIIEGNSDAYQVISNITHRRVRATDSREQRLANGEHPEMISHKFLKGCKVISEKINDFSYDIAIRRAMDDDELKILYNSSTSGYEKLQIFRILNTTSTNSVITKFINETYHIENEFIFQLDPMKFDMIPEYVVLTCDRILNESS